MSTCTIPLMSIVIGHRVLFLRKCHTRYRCCLLSIHFVFYCIGFIYLINVVDCLIGLSHPSNKRKSTSSLSLTSSFCSIRETGASSNSCQRMMTSKEIDEQQQQHNESFQSLPLDQYPSLHSIALSSTAYMIGLYFSASWCPDCVTATPLVEKVILTSNHDEHNNNKWIDIVYISSDQSEDNMKQFKPKTFLEIPYNNNKERTKLKKFFGTCAMKELNDCQMTIKDRKHGIPTLILINPSTGKIYTDNGMDIIEKYHHSTTSMIQDEWKSLLSSLS